MMSRPSGGNGSGRVLAFCLVAAIASVLRIFRASAQTPQPWLFVETIANNKPTGALACLALAVNACGGGSSRSLVQQPPPRVTPTATYTLTGTGSSTPSASTKSFLLSPICLTLVVK